ncbi:DUF6215 domain-containing protein [Streptomyces sp.]|uniref:DUF6215 domain-containing protein n=1 Tax=Streptomyces sp. TaxID=1931 RepID=UPI002F95B7A5
MADDIDALPKGAGMVGQVVAGLTLVPALCVGLWALGDTANSNSGAPQPATCAEGKTGKASEEPGQVPGRVSGTQLCKALNRPDLADLLGTPTETLKSASGSDGSFKLGSGKEIATPSSRVEFGTYTVTLSASYDRLPVAGSAAYLGRDAQERTVLGRPAVLSSDYTLSISFRLDGSDAHSGPGVPARSLTVARDAKDSGGSLTVTVWREGGGVPDDAVLLRVAEKVLPTVPGWNAAG